MPSHSGVEHDLFEPPPPPDANAISDAAEAAAVDLSDAALSERPPRNDSAPPLFDLTHTAPVKAGGAAEDIDFLLGLQGSRGTTAALQNPSLADLAKKPVSEPPPFPIDVEVPVSEPEVVETTPEPTPAKRERTPPHAPSLAAVASQTAPPPRAATVSNPPLKPRKRPAALIAVAALGLSGAVLASTMLTRQPATDAGSPLPAESAEPAATTHVTRPGSPEPTSAEPEPPPSAEAAAAPQSRAAKTPSRPASVGSKPLPPEKVSTPSSLAPRPEPARPEPARTEPVRPAPPITPRPSAPRAPVGAGFDRQAAINALTTQAGQASSCRKGEDPSGTATVIITFAPSGRVTSANVSGPPFAGTPTGGCIAAAFRRARVPEFDGENVTVSKTVVIH